MAELNFVKLGKRLSAIEAMVTKGYDHIWDCCCDHGLLGFQLLAKERADEIHFVDIVSPLMEEIEDKLTRFYLGDKRWHVHCQDVASLPIAQYKQHKHLVIIAGVGGKLLIELLEQLFPLTVRLNVEFILSPVHHNYQLRDFLSKNGATLITELLIEENGRFYELLHIKHGPGDTVSLVGDKMWDFANEHHLCYLRQTIAHYQRIANNPNINVSQIIKDYQALLPCV